MTGLRGAKPRCERLRHGTSTPTGERIFAARSPECGHRFQDAQDEYALLEEVGGAQVELGCCKKSTLPGPVIGRADALGQPMGFIARLSRGHRCMPPGPGLGW
jgi:hypothetical protein